MLKHLRLENFRNHTLFELDLEKTTALIGPNGAGKSNVLEAISLLAFCRSFREEDKRVLVNLEHDYARATGDDLEVFIQKNPSFLMQVKAGGVVKKQLDFVGTLKTVIFSPEAGEIILGGPKNRRRFLDIMISQGDRNYLKSLAHYEKIRAQRNSLLCAIAENRAQALELDFWDQEFVSYGAEIIEKRAATIAFLAEHLSELYSAISGKENSRLEISYQSSAKGDFAKTLKQNRQREILLRCSVTGPHRDDFFINVEGANAANFASRGELRTIILALKISELQFLTKGKEKPILLLDDVFSELDESHRRHLGKLISQYQTVITTTDRDHLSAELTKKSKIVEI